MVGIIDKARGNVGAVGDPIVTHLVADDKVPWYKKPNLRYMYIWLFLCCMGVEMTSGFDSQLINTLQYSQHWHKCTHPSSNSYPPNALLRSRMPLGY